VAAEEVVVVACACGRAWADLPPAARGYPR
jgi:hypothetical protein